MKIKPLVLQPTTTLKDAIRQMDYDGYGVLPIVDGDNTFLGLLTDGDIRRAVLNDATDLSLIINRDALTLRVESTIQQRKQFLKQHHRRHLPIVDVNGRYAQMFIMDELEFNTKPNAVVIMAGGLGSRLGELTKKTPKSMLAVGHKPMLLIVLETYIEHGFSTFYFAVNYKKEQIMEFFGDGSQWGIKIHYLEEEKRLGTGGALSLIQEQLEHSLLVSNADVFSSVDYDLLLQQHQKEGSVATMCTRIHEYTVPYGVVKALDNQIVSMEEKPTDRYLINSGIYLLNPEVLSFVPKNNYFDMPILFETLIAEGFKCSTFNIDGYWVDIGLVEEYESIKKKFGY